MEMGYLTVLHVRLGAKIGNLHAKDSHSFCNKQIRYQFLIITIESINDLTSTDKQREQTSKQANIRPLLTPRAIARGACGHSPPYCHTDQQLDHKTWVSSSPLDKVVTLREGLATGAQAQKIPRVHTHIPLAVQYQVVRTDESPLRLQQALGGGRHGVYGNSQQEIAHRGRSRYGRNNKYTAINRQGLAGTQ